MNRQRSIEQVLDIWLADGPSVMPDRLFEAVLDRVERVPQRRLARLYLRLTDMTPRIRLLTLAAAGLVVALVGLMLVKGTANLTVGASPSPAATSVPSAQAAIPDALRFRWMTGPRPIGGGLDNAALGLLFDAFGNVVVSPGNNNGLALHRWTAVAVPGQLRFTGDASGSGCNATDVGAYTWSLSASGRTLTLGGSDDSCATRLAIVPGIYEKMDCPNITNNCLGPIDAGTHRSQFVDPFIGPGETWAPRYGALTYTVPAGWLNDSDYAQDFGLLPEGSPDGTVIAMGTDAVAPSETDACSEIASTTIAQDAKSIAEWVASAPGVVATFPVKLKIGGHDAWRVDVSMDPAWTTKCPKFSNGGPGRIMFVDRSPADCFSAALVPGQRDRYYLIDVEGRAFLVQIEAMTAAAYAGFVDRASAIVEGMGLTP